MEAAETGTDDVRNLNLGPEAKAAGCTGHPTLAEATLVRAAQLVHRHPVLTAHQATDDARLGRMRAGRQASAEQLHGRPLRDRHVDG